jgi:ABC-type transport system substrate-binding protein
LLACTQPKRNEHFAIRIAVLSPLGRVTAQPNAVDNSSVAQTWVFEPLVRLDSAGQLVPAVASRVERRPLGRFHVELRGDRTFSDGAPVTAADVERSLIANSLRMIRDGNGYLIEPNEERVISEVQLIRTMVFRESGGTVLGSGPFKVVEESPARLRLVRRTPARGRIDEAILLAYNTPRETFEHTLKGDANLVYLLEPGWLEFFDGVPRLRIVRGPGLQTDSVVFNPRLPRAQRAALAQALSSNSVRELAFGDDCAEARNRAAPETAVPAGPSLNVITWPAEARFALAVRRRLGQRGNEIETLPAEELASRLRAGKFDLTPLRVLVWPPSMAALTMKTRGPSNFWGYSNAKVDAALDAGDWAAAKAALDEDPPAAFVCTRERIAVVDARIKNPTLGPYDLLETLPEWEVEQ